MITEKERIDLIKFRLEQAENAQMEAQKLLENGFLMGATNRIYYAIFYAVMALALKHRFETSKHQQLLGWFNKNFIHTEKIEVHFGKIYRDSFSNRMEGDYEPYIDFDKETVEQMYADMRLFLDRIRKEIGQTA
jgi:uncharacterized protein (UPF0332 family)